MKKPRKVKVALYVRASTTGKPFNKDGAQIQVARLTAYANVRGYQISGVYYDIGSGGRVFRPELDRMIKEIESKKIIAKRILCVSSDQYSRKYFQLLAFLKRIDSAGAEFEFIEEPPALEREKRQYNKKK